MIPFYIYYSMFGFQRVGDLAWAAGDMRARGFLLGGTAGRTTLNGEGLQHEDGHSHLLASTIPNCVSYDPTFAYELAVIIQDGLRRMYQEQEDVYYYITVMNENYAHPAMPEGVEKGILRGMYLLSRRAKASKEPAQGAAPRQRHDPARGHRGRGAAGKGLRRRRRHLERHQLQRAAARRPRDRALEHAASRKPSRGAPTSSSACRTTPGPVIAATDYMKTFADQIRPFLPQPRSYSVLGTDGFGRSDTRQALRRFFEVDRHYVAVAALKALADQEALPQKKVTEAIGKYGIDPEKPNPAKV